MLCLRFIGMNVFISQQDVPLQVERPWFSDSWFDKGVLNMEGKDTKNKGICKGKSDPLQALGSQRVPGS